MSENKTFDFELVAPERRMVDGPMWQVVMPGTEGEFGVRSGHCALVSSLGPGVISIWRTEDEHPKRYFVSGGFAHVTDENCTVLAEHVQELADLNLVEIEQELKNLEDEKSLASEIAEHKLVDEKIELARVRLNAVRYYR